MGRFPSAMGLFVVVQLLILLGVPLLRAGSEGFQGRMGGPCEYNHYQGKARITSIKELPEPNQGREKFEVKFIFLPEEEIKESFARVEGREFLLLLANSTYPDGRFLDRYQVKPGRVFDCILKVIRKGTCTPMMFDFPGINLSEYEKEN
jgi:hypothetical protein